MFKILIPTSGAVILGLILLPVAWPLLILGVKIGCVASAVAFLLAACKG